MSHLIQNTSLGSGRHPYCWNGEWSSSRNIRPNPFFRRPHIHFSDLKCNPTNGITITGSSKNPELFDGNVWTINVQNRKYGPFSHNASDCEMSMRWFENSVDSGRSTPLSWKRNPFPTTCNYPSALKNHDDYIQKLPWLYIGELARHHLRPTILSNNSAEILLIFTLNESLSVHFVSESAVSLDYLISIPFNKLEEHQFLLLFHSKEYKDTQGKNFKLKANSWNDVKLTWI
jgi:hypothetical protein